MLSYQVTASIVLYNPERAVFKAIDSFLNVKALSIFLYLIDNSPTNIFQKSNKALLEKENVTYIFTGKNPGYGAAHNIAIKQIIDKSEYHLVLNPDVYFEPEILNVLYNYASANSAVGHLIPKVLYPDGRLQYVCKLIPTPFNLIARLLPNNFLKKYNERFELRFSGYNKIMEAPYLHGCFMFLRCSALKNIGLFDERFFMYPEDIDLTRRMHKQFKTIFYPFVYIIHEHKKTSFKNVRMFAVHVQNMIRYFNKWGWLFDYERRKVNAAVLLKIKSETN